MDRRDIILAQIDTCHTRGLEFGPLDKPIVTRSAGEIAYLDHLSTVELREKYRNDANVKKDNIVDVDHVIQDGIDLRALLGDAGKFDYVVASHVFEHLPNPIDWLEEIWSILTPGGKISLALPDKRFCFDCLRRLASTADLVEAHLLKRKAPSLRAIFDHVSNFALKEGKAGWDSSTGGSLPEKQYSLESAYELAKTVAQDGSYHDVHSWVFTLRSFLLILRDLMELRLVRFSVCYCHPTMGLEFYVTLKKEEGEEPVELNADVWKTLAPE